MELMPLRSMMLVAPSEPIRLRVWVDPLTPMMSPVLATAMLVWIPRGGVALMILVPSELSRSIWWDDPLDRSWTTIASPGPTAISRGTTATARSDPDVAELIQEVDGIPTEPGDMTPTPRRVSVNAIRPSESAAIPEGDRKGVPLIVLRLAIGRNDWSRWSNRRFPRSTIHTDPSGAKVASDAKFNVFVSPKVPNEAMTLSSLTRSILLPVPQFC